MKKQRKTPFVQQEAIKLDFGSFGKISSSNYKQSNSLPGFNNLNNDPFSKNNLFNKNNSTSNLLNSFKKRDVKAIFNDAKFGFFENKNIALGNRESGLIQDKFMLKTSFLKGRESVGAGLDMGMISEISDKLRGLGNRDVENLSNNQVKELLNLANLITKVAKNSKYYS